MAARLLPQKLASPSSGLCKRCATRVSRSSPLLPEGLDEALRLWHALFIDGVATVLRQAYKGREDDMHSIVREILHLSEQDPPLTAESLLDVLFGRDVVRAKFLEQMERYPILVCPVSAIPAFRHGERSWTIGNKTVQYLDAFSYSQCFNLLGNPAAVVPMGRSAEGLPIGVQIVGRPWEEERVLAISRCVEQAGGWKEPPAAVRNMARSRQIVLCLLCVFAASPFALSQDGPAQAIRLNNLGVAYMNQARID